MLNNFFRINLPYGIAKNENNEWMAFNREYMPLGFNDLNFKEHPVYSYKDNPIYTRYKRLTEAFLIDLAGGEKWLSRNDSGEKVSNSKDQLWDNYFKKIQKLSKIERQISIS